METKQGRRIYSREFKQEAVRLVRASDQSLAAVARDLGIDGNSLRQWQSGNAQKSSMACRLFRAKGAVTMRSWRSCSAKSPVALGA